MGKRTMRGETAIIGIGETTDYKRGRSPDPEFKLVIEAILKAWTDAGIEPEEIDGFASYSNDRNNPSRSRRRDPRRARCACQRGCQAVVGGDSGRQTWVRSMLRPSITDSPERVMGRSSCSGSDWPSR